METFIRFFSFTEPNVRWVVLGMIAICASSAAIGTFAFLRKRALIGDAVSHSILPGVCLAFLFTESKTLYYLLPGAFVTGWLSILMIDWITQYSKIKPDAAISLVLSVFYGAGILLLTSIQNSGSAGQSGLDKFLFGKAAAMVYEDVLLFTLFFVIVFLLIYLFFQPLRLISFDRDFALATGMPVKWMEIILSVLTVMTVAMGIQAIGVVLMASLLIIPAAAARYWTNSLPRMILLAVLISVISGILGAYVSYIFPKMPTGPWVVSILFLCSVLSLFAGSNQGIGTRLRVQWRNKRKMLEENILKCFYHLSEFDNSFDLVRSKESLLSKRMFEKNELNLGIKSLLKKNLLQNKGNGFLLTDKGIEEGKRITRIHRLWEMYLNKKLNLPSDHLHEDAEAIEHIITPELEKELQVQLGFPTVDPHQSPIP